MVKSTLSKNLFQYYYGSFFSKQILYSIDYDATIKPNKTERNITTFTSGLLKILIHRANWVSMEALQLANEVVRTVIFRLCLAVVYQGWSGYELLWFSFCVSINSCFFYVSFQQLILFLWAKYLINLWKTIRT